MSNDRFTDAHLPRDARNLGLMTETAPELAAAGSLRSDRRSHRIIAWIALAAIVVGPIGSIATFIGLF